VSIYPITVERLPVFCLLGHSNADGWTSTEDTFAAYPHLLPGTAAPLLFPEQAWYKNVYAFTSAIPWVGSAGTPTATDIGDGEWLELAVGYPDSPAAPFPHPSPYVYPNNQGACYSHWGFKAFPLAVPDLGVRCGMEIPMQWFWRNHWNSQVGFVKLAFGSSFLLPADQGASAGAWFNVFGWTPADPARLEGTVDTTNQQYDFQAWWTPADHFDFAPTTKRFFQKWLDKMAGAQAALPDGTKMDVRLIIPWMGDNDSLARKIDALTNFKQFVLEFVRLAREACVNNDWTTLPKEQITRRTTTRRTARSAPTPTSTTSSPRSRPTTPTSRSSTRRATRPCSMRA
jgi:hypothetical protein